MTSRVPLCPLLFAGALAVSHASAQHPTRAVRGVVFDSLRGTPLRNAFVTMPGRPQPTETDARGRFSFDNVAPGTYTITAQHPLLDSIGLSGLMTRANVSEASGDIELAIPSFETIWKATCAGRAPRDSGIVFGTIRRATTGAAVSGATLELAWTDLVLSAPRVVQRTWHVDTRSNERGSFAVCGVPMKLRLRVAAHDDSSASGGVDLTPSDIRVRRRDLLVGPAKISTATAGTIAGTVLDADGHLEAAARVRTDGSPEVRTDADGRFTLAGVPAGTRELEVLSLGRVPVLSTVDVRPHDTSLVVVRLQKLVTLSAIRTSAARGNRVFAAEFDARRRSGFGYMKDSAQLAKYSQLMNVFRDIPGLDVQYRTSNLLITVPDGVGGRCQPMVIIDGIEAAFNHLIDLLPSEVGGLEVYTRAAHIPPRFVPTGIQPQCGMILVWTKYAFRNR
ncbi:MAG: carboxypeptidase regulatory-like domain-containing protein [Gemmatimonadaceae bacterium]